MDHIPNNEEWGNLLDGMRDYATPKFEKAMHLNADSINNN